MRQPTEAEKHKIVYTNTKSPKDKVDWFPVLGVWAWDTKHSNGLKDYTGDDGSEIQLMWENDNPTAYHKAGWSL